MDIFGTIATYVMGAVMRDVQEMRGQRDQGRAEVAMTVEEIRATRERYRTWFEASGRFPRIVRLMDGGLDPEDPATRDERFQFGLGCVLDGIAARLAPRALRGAERAGSRGGNDAPERRTAVGCRDGRRRGKDGCR